MDIKTNKVMVFGVFDGFDEGHRYFLNEAKKHGDYLIVVVAPESEVKLLKNKEPLFSLEDRIEKIKSSGIADLVIAGDANHGSWNVITAHRPNVIALGHDQDAIEESLKEYRESHLEKFEIVRIGETPQNLSPF